jgi:hypothetical protein
MDQTYIIDKYGVASLRNGESSPNGENLYKIMRRVAAESLYGEMFEGILIMLRVIES